MKDWIPYLIVLIVAFGAGMLVMHSCEKKPTPATVRDTVYTNDDTVVITRIVPVTRERIVYRDAPAPTDDSPCWPLLNLAYHELDSTAHRLWALSELEVDGRIESPGISGTIGWSTPRHLESGQGFTYDLRATQTTNTYLPPGSPSFFDRFGYGIHAGAGAALTPTGTYPALYVGVGVHFDFKGVF